MKQLLLLILSLVCFSASTYATCELAPKFAYSTKGLSVKFTNTSTGDFNNAVWYFEDGTISDEMSPTHTFEAPGTYTFSVTISNNEGCSEVKEGKVHVFNTNNTFGTTTNEVSNLEVETISGLTNYPNPFNRYTNVSFYLHQDSDVNIQLFDMSGKMVRMVKSGMMNAGNHEFSMERDGLINGIYLLTLTSNNKTYTKKLSVQ